MPKLIDIELINEVYEKTIQIAASIIEQKEEASPMLLGFEVKEASGVQVYQLVNALEPAQVNTLQCTPEGLAIMKQAIDKMLRAEFIETACDVVVHVSEAYISTQRHPKQRDAITVRVYTLDASYEGYALVHTDEDGKRHCGPALALMQSK